MTPLDEDADFDLLALVARHDQLWPRLTEDSSGDFLARISDLEIRIAATPALTPEGLIGKRRVVDRAGFHDDEGILAAVLRLDAERISESWSVMGFMPAAGLAPHRRAS